MSIDTWMAEFYPTFPESASDIHEAIDHCLHKWKGMLPENADRHGIMHVDEDRGIIDSEDRYFAMDNTSCALCIRMNDRCDDCPLSIVIGRPCYNAGAPYDVWRNTGNARPLVRALIDAKRLFKRIKRIEDAEAKDIQRSSPLAMPTWCKTTKYI
jgi:hypothetical protein